MFGTKPHDDAVAWMSGDFPFEAILLDARVREELGEITQMSVRLEVEQRVSPADFLGKAMRVHVELEPGTGRSFSGLCISAEARIDGKHTFVEAEVRPWLWLLTRNRDSRIFQEKTVKEIIEEVFSDAGFSDYEMKLNGTYDKRTYCVQYRESDFDFITRLMQQEGIYYYVKTELNELETIKLVLCDDIGGHDPVPLYDTIEYAVSDRVNDATDDQIYDWQHEHQVVSGKVTLDDYDFLAPTSDLKAVNIKKSGKHPHTDIEVYDTPGRQMIDGMAPGSEVSRGENLARVRQEAEVARFETWRGRTGVRTMAVGKTFNLTDHPVQDQNGEYLVTSAVHEIEADYGRHFQDRNRDRAVYACTFTAQPSAVPYRSRAQVPWPEIAGLHTALVVGPSGEEIYTDEHGRIKVQFHWDRVGKKDEKSSCWVRVVTPWSGNKWGMIHIPRIGQEVVIQFEEGDPDRPICTGMLYNKDTMPPYELPDNKTQSGIKTDSSKDVNDTSHFNELMFEDKAGNELIRMQAQKNHDHLVKNKHNVTVGFPSMDYGDHADDQTSFSTVVKDTVSQKITDGDKFLLIETGSETQEIATDQSITIGNDQSQAIGNNQTETVGNDQSVDIGNNREENIGNDKSLTVGNNQTRTIGSDDETSVGSNMKVSVGKKLEVTAGQEILLKVGSNSIKIDNSGIKITGMMVKIEGKALFEAKSKMSQLKGSVMVVVKGGVTMIN